MVNTLDTFKVGQRVQLNPVCDLWMRGARWGNVEKIGRKYVSVRLDMLPNRLIKFAPQYLMEVND